MFDENFTMGRWERLEFGDVQDSVSRPGLDRRCRLRRERPDVPPELERRSARNGSNPLVEGRVGQPKHARVDQTVGLDRFRNSFP